jgi:hypothetical protein
VSDPPLNPFISPGEEWAKSGLSKEIFKEIEMRRFVPRVCLTIVCAGVVVLACVPETFAQGGRKGSMQGGNSGAGMKGGMKKGTGGGCQGQGISGGMGQGMSGGMGQGMMGGMGQGMKGGMGQGAGSGMGQGIGGGMGMMGGKGGPAATASTPNSSTDPATVLTYKDQIDLTPQQVQKLQNLEKAHKRLRKQPDANAKNETPQQTPNLDKALSRIRTQTEAVLNDQQKQKIQSLIGAPAASGEPNQQPGMHKNAGGKGHEMHGKPPKQANPPADGQP